MKDLLPLGSVVTLDEGTKSLIIIGTRQIDEEKHKYDYISCPFPEGYIDDETFFLFNHEDISDVKFIGFVNAETQLYSSAIREAESMQSEDDSLDDVDYEMDEFEEEIIEKEAGQNDII